MNSSTDFSATYQSGKHRSDLIKSIESKEKKDPVDSPPKKHRSQPAMRTPEKNKKSLPELQLHDLPKPDEVIFEQFKSPSRRISFRSSSMRSPSGINDLPESKTSPRSSRSPRNEHETMSSRRHRIESPRANRSGQEPASNPVSPPFSTTTNTVTQTVTSTVQTSNAEALNQPSPEQLDTFADLWIQHLLGSSSIKSGDQVSSLTVAKINALGRNDGKIDASALPQVFSGLRVQPDKQGKVSLSSVLNSLLANHLGQSDAGKTIKTMQAVAMQANPTLAALSFDDMIDMGDADKQKELRQTMADAIKGQVKACVDIAFGPSSKLSECHLPQSLLDFWKMLDARLVKEAAKNPALTAEDILTARSNLGFDLLITRQIYPFTLKPAQAMAGTEATSPRVTSETALPVLSTVFANSVREAALVAWPAFFKDAIASFDA